MLCVSAVAPHSDRAIMMSALAHLKRPARTGWLPSVLWGEIAAYVSVDDVKRLDSVDRAARQGAHLGVSTLVLRQRNFEAIVTAGRYPNLTALTVTMLRTVCDLHYDVHTLQLRESARPTILSKLSLQLFARAPIADGPVIRALLMLPLRRLEAVDISLGAASTHRLSVCPIPLSVHLIDQRFDGQRTISADVAKLLLAPRLIGLSIASSNVAFSAPMCDALARCKGLEILQLPGRAVTRSAAPILANLPSLTQLGVGLMGSAAANIVAKSTSLTWLHINRLDESHLALLQMPQLRSVSASSGIALAAAVALQSHRYEEVDIRWRGLVPAATIVALLCAPIDHLSLHGGWVDPDEPKCRFAASMASITCLQVDLYQVSRYLNEIVLIPSLQNLTILSKRSECDWIWRISLYLLRRGWCAEGKQADDFQSAYSDSAAVTRWMHDDGIDSDSESDDDWAPIL